MTKIILCIYAHRSNVKGASIGHYTQLVWADTYLVGCAVIQYKTNNVNEYQTYCNYGPAGNVHGKAVYKTGNKPGGQCPTGTKANTKTGLCCLCKQ